MNLTDEDVDEILRLLEKSPYRELKLKTDTFTLELKQDSGRHEASGPGGAAEDVEAVAAIETSPAAAKNPPATAAVGGGEILEIRPPLTGTFYRAPSPGAEPFTEVGQAVEPDSILCLVETMKLMNSVVAGCYGEVVEICIDNGQLVEAEDVLLRIRVTDDG